MNNDFLKIYEELDNLTEDSDKKRKNSLDLSEADLKKLDKYFKEKLFEYNNEFEDEYRWGPGFYTDEINYNLEYKNDKYFLELTVYHASEDNNAENEDYFTDYYDEEYDTIEDFYAEYPEVVEDLFKSVKDDLEENKDAFDAF